MDYKVIAFNKLTAQIVIQFDARFGPTCIDLPVNENNEVPTGAELDALVMTFKPTSYIERLDSLAANEVANADTILAMIEQTPTAGVQPSADDIRIYRNSLLTSCDWTQLSDAPITTEMKAIWDSYRQALRDVPQQSTFPTSVEWPVIPFTEY